MSKVMNIPPISDVGTAIRIYYEKTFLGTSDIMQLFNVKQGKAINLKKAVQEKMIEKNIVFFNSRCVDTEIAFDVWGIDITNLEKRFNKLKKYEMLV